MVGKEPATNDSALLTLECKRATLLFEGLVARASPHHFAKAEAAISNKKSLVTYGSYIIRGDIGILEKKMEARTSPVSQCVEEED